ncbi:MAG: hypothetical protein ABSE73_28890 [Planctomycetota bacterium]
MVFPTAEHSPFVGEGDFRSQMIEYIKTHFGDFLGEDVELLDLPDGLDLIQEKYPLRAAGLRMAQAAQRPYAVAPLCAEEHRARSVAVA